MLTFPRHMRAVLLGVAVLLVLGALGCTGDRQDGGAALVHRPLPLGDTLPPLSDALPGLPDDDLLGRVASVEVEQTKQGSETHSASPGAMPAGSTLVLSTTELNPLEWGVYLFPLAGNEPLRFETNVSVVAGFYWLAVGNYDTGSWELSGPFDVPLAQAVTLPSADYVSPGGNAALAVLAAPQGDTLANIIVNSVTLVSDDGTTPNFSIAGTISDLDTSGPLAGVTVTLEPGSIDALTNAGGEYVFLDLPPGDYTVTPALEGYVFVPPSRNVELTDADVLGQDFTGEELPATPSLSGTVETAGAEPIADVSMYLVSLNLNGSINAAAFRSTTTDATGNYEFADLAPGNYRLIPQKNSYAFSDNIAEFAFSVSTTLDFTGTPVSLPATVTYNAHMRPLLFEPVCMNCHDSGKAGAARNFAPASVNWDTYGGTTEFTKTSGNGRVQGDTMPPSALGFKTTAFQKSLYQAWLDDGFPEN